ncbi:hypothetical protein HK099_003956 [Clydaea vesicula]|uniref:Phospholipase A-2-activating protein n=1 Tax=Clydaea vesicula TaxID=447962 RepID=A0AAD5U1B6_9FUNG|nr:hypothetical protein HK099_003956 [Clydaea vesicula]
MTKFFTLSSTLSGHSQDVKAVAVVKHNQNVVVSASRDKAVYSWTRENQNTFNLQNRYLSHNHFVNSLTTLKKSNEYPNGLIVSGSADKTINVFDLSNSSEPIYSLIGHTDNVCVLTSNENGDIISGSWDKTIRIWRDWTCIYTCKGHEHAVWGLLALNDDKVLSASADKTIKLWKNGKCLQTFIGHTDVVRSLSLAPQGFISSSNDGTMRVWTFDGECVAELVGHTSFVYAVKTLPSGEFVSCGEDRSIRIWDGSVCTQTLHLPCVSVWCLDVFDNGDIVCGGNDSHVRIFTRSEERRANSTDLKAFDDAVSAHAIPSNQVGDVDKNKLPGLDALNSPGKKNGQVIMVRNGEKVEAHQWDNSEWQKIGEVVDAVGNTKKKMYNNIEYDYVFDIDIDEGAPPLKLPYNVTENPYQTAQNFIHLHELPQGYLDQIANFITSNTKGHSIGPTASTSQYSDPFTGAGRYVPAGKIQSLNSDLIETDLKLTSNELKNLESLVSKMANEKSILSMEELSVLKKIAFCWNFEKRFPGFDVFRLVVLKRKLTNIFPEGDSLLQGNVNNFFDFLKDKVNFPTEFHSSKWEKSLETNVMLGLRIICNLFDNEFNLDLISTYLLKLYSIVQYSWKNSSNAQLSITVLCKNNIDDSLSVDMAANLSEFLKLEIENENKFRCLVTLGKLLDMNELAKEAAKLSDLENFLKQHNLAENSDERIVGVGREVLHILRK